ncbi:MAG: type VI secretion system protein TssA [Gammaproteobacteria bacterium]|nr:type VI secretion system protein TssA [Gammaproteobacteria bacterium]
MNTEKSVPLTDEEWQGLLAPCSETQPCGESLVYEGTCDKIREARRADDPSLPQGDWKTKLKKADWDKVRELCVEALSTRSKDLQLAAWLTEALLHLHGYPGFNAGLRLLIQLGEKYWKDLFPPLEGEDLELRISPFVWMNEKLDVPLGLVVITAPATDDAVPYTFIDRENAWLLEKADPQEKKTAEEQGKATYTKFLTSATLTPRDFLAHLAANLQATLESLEQLNLLLDDNCGKQAPGFGKLRQILAKVQHVINTMLKEKPDLAEEADMHEPETAETTEAGAIPASPEPNTAAGSIRSRGEAYRQLAEAADYLLRTEPHSPTPYLVKRAISWGNMSLTELLLELVNNEQDLAAIYGLLGIKFDEK